MSDAQNSGQNGPKKATAKKSAPAHGENSPQTRSVSRLQREGTSEGAGMSGETAEASRSKSQRKEQRRKNRDGSAETRRGSSAAAVDLTDLANLDVPSIIYDVVACVERKEAI